MLKLKIEQWFRQRFDVDSFKHLAEKQIAKPLPKNVSWFHTLGSMSLFLFVNQVLTGILLLVYYSPTAHDAFERIKFITTTAHMGWLIRQLHAWGANLMIIVVLLHLLRTFVTGSYKKPRELTWISGCVLVLLTMVFGFTGYLLPWNQLAYWATTVGTEIAGAVPVIGEYVKILLRGGTSIGGETISRFFVVHVIILPWALFFVVSMHLFLVRYQGIATMDPVDAEPKVAEKNGIPFFPDHVLKEGIALFILIGILLTLCVLFPFELGEKADPLKTPYAIKPEWYFLPMYQMLKYLPKLVGIAVMPVAGLLLVLWPFIDRTKERHPFRRPFSITLGVLALLSVMVLSALGYVSETRKTFFGKTYEFNIYGVPHRVDDIAARPVSSKES